jgi:hypothetical protein
MSKRRPIVDVDYGVDPERGPYPLAPNGPFTDEEIQEAYALMMAEAPRPVDPEDR